MSRFSKVIAVLLTFVFALTVLQKPAEAANPISPKQSRVTYTIKDANGMPYKIYFAGVQEKKAIASTDRNDWASADIMYADKGDLLYTGNYTLYTHNPKTSHIKKSKFYFKNYLLNATRKTVYTVPSRYKGQPDLLLVAYAIGEGYESADWFYMRNGVLTKIIEGDIIYYSKRPQIIGKNKYLTALDDPEYKKWLFLSATINPAKATYVRDFPEYNNPGAVIRNWKTHWK